MSTSDIRNLHSSYSPSQLSGLTKSATTSRVTQSPKAFGEKTYMNKEDYERERTRWLAKLDDIESRLAESETLNSDMHQIKAELNKKIVEMERNQKPLIEQNRRVSERNRVLQQEVKRVERKLCHSRDDFLTLKDQHDRLQKENVQLKERRIYPEKLEELERYKTQVLEYSKCITALRTAGAEKDRRYEMIVQKFKKLRRCVKKNDEDDNRSTTSDWSGDSLLSLDPINEDFEEALNTDYRAQFKENAEIQRSLNELKFTPFGHNEEAALKEQVASLQSTIAHQQTVIEANQEMISHSVQLKAIVSSQQQKIKELEHQLDRMKQEIAASKDANELLEFQVLEMEETKSEGTPPPPAKADKSMDAEQSFDEGEIAPVVTKEFTPEEVSSLKKSFDELRSASNLKLAQRRVVGETQGYLNGLEEKVLASTANEKNAAEYESKIQKLENDVLNAKAIQIKRDELHIEIIELRKRLQELDTVKLAMAQEMKTVSRELIKVRAQLTSKDAELEKERKLAEGLNQQLQVLVGSGQTEKEDASERAKQLEETSRELAEVKQSLENLQKEKEDILAQHEKLAQEYEKFKEEQRPSIRTELERRYEETKYRLNMALEKIQKYETVLETAKKHEDDEGKLSDALQDDLVQLKEYNEHLERQFKSQTDIIDALKEKLMQHKRLSELVNKLINVTKVDSMLEKLQSCTSDLDKESVKLVDNIIYIVQMCSKQAVLSAMTPLEISTAHHKIRPNCSVDSSGEWMSNSSDGVNSPEEGTSPAQVS